VDYDLKKPRIDAGLPAHDAREDMSLIQSDTEHSVVKKLKLENGMTVLLKEVKSHPVVSVQVWHRIGSHDERVEVNGVSHLLEHLLFKGTKDRPIQFMRLFYVLGADANAFTNYDVTVYHEQAIKENLYPLLALEADRMTNAIIDKDSVLSERDVVVSELAGYEGKPLYRLGRALMNYTFGESGYGLPVGGYISDVQNFTVEEVLEHYEKHYGPGNATLVVVGDFDTVTTTEWIHELFGPPAKAVSQDTPAMSHMLLFYLLVMDMMFPFNPILALFFHQYILSMWTGLVANSPSAVQSIPMPAHQSAHAKKLSLQQRFPSTSQTTSKSSTASGNLMPNTIGPVTSDFGNLKVENELKMLQTDLVTSKLVPNLSPNTKKASSKLLKRMVDEMVQELEQEGPPQLSTQSTWYPPGPFPAPAPWMAQPAAVQQKKSQPAEDFVLTTTKPMEMEEESLMNLHLVQIIFPMPELKYGHDDMATLHVIDELLTGGHVGLMTRQFLESNVGWDEVGTDFSNNVDLGWYSVVMNVYSDEDAKKGQKAVADLFHALQHAEVEKDDLDRAKVNVLASMLVDREEITEMAHEMGQDFVLGGDITFSARYRDDIKTVSASDIRKFMSKWFKSGSGRVGIFKSRGAAAAQTDGDSHDAAAAKVSKTSSNDESKESAASTGSAKQEKQSESEKTQDTSSSPTSSEPTAAEKPSTTTAAVPPVEVDVGAFPWNIDSNRAPAKKLRLFPENIHEFFQTSELSHELKDSLGYLDPETTLKYLPELKPLKESAGIIVDPGLLVVLKNGMEVRLIKTESDLVQISGRILSGSALDPDGQTGLSALTNAMLMQGSQNFSYADLILNLEDDGSKFSITSGRETTTVTGSALTENVRRLLLVAREALQYPAFQADVVDIVRDSLSSASDPSVLSLEERGRQLLQQLVYPEGHPMHHFPTPETVKSITREDVVNFHAKHIGPQTTKLVMTGNFVVSEMKELLEDIFGGWKQPEASAPKFEYPTVHEVRGNSVQESVTGAANVISLVGRGGISRCSPSYLIAMVANEILGGDTLSARLGTHVRDQKGLTYGVYSTYESGVGTGMFVIRMQTAPDKTEEALSAMYDVLNDFVAHGVHELEVELAKRSLIGQHVMSLGTSQRVGSFLLGRQLCGTDDPLAEIELTHQKLLAVTVDEVNEHIKQYMRPEKFHQVVIGAV
jgi:predicted Zn-dependent peptidase